MSLPPPDTIPSCDVSAALFAFEAAERELLNVLVDASHELHPESRVRIAEEHLQPWVKAAKAAWRELFWKLDVELQLVDEAGADPRVLACRISGMLSGPRPGVPWRSVDW